MLKNSALKLLLLIKVAVIIAPPHSAESFNNRDRRTLKSSINARILWIESKGKRATSPSFIPALRQKGCQVEAVETGGEALALLEAFDPDLVVVNAASMRTSGIRICKSMREKANSLPILIFYDQDQMQATTCADVVLTLPFTSRKLLNRITPLVPGSSENCLHSGPIRLDLERKKVICQGRESSLTPRLITLLAALMRRPNEVLEREKLFQEVWETAYTVDTRTLDVHISWLRKAIEKDPRNPRFLKTIRGVGYRLDVPPSTVSKK